MTALRDRPAAREPRVSPFYIPATAPVSIQGRRVLKHGDCFALLDEFGSAQATGPGPEGLFFEDTRYLSQLHLTIDDQRPLLLSSRMTEDNAMLSVDLANPDLQRRRQAAASRRHGAYRAWNRARGRCAVPDPGSQELWQDPGEISPRLPSRCRFRGYLRAARGGPSTPRRAAAGGVAPGRPALRLSRPGRGHPPNEPGLRSAARGAERLSHELAHRSCDRCYAAPAARCAMRAPRQPTIRTSGHDARRQPCGDRAPRRRASRPRGRAHQQQ